MKIVEAGHRYLLKRLDDPTFQYEPLTFVKREGRNYPGNFSTHTGTNLQETWRCCIDRLQYLDAQVPHFANKLIVSMLRTCIILLEIRAAERHERPVPRELNDPFVELIQTCDHCGHIGCEVGPYS